MSFAHQLTGKRFTRLVALYPTGEKRRGQIVWKCQCDCGRQVDVCSYHLTSGNTKSCRCLNDELIRARSITHGLSNSPEYNSWSGMHTRCYNPNNPKYPRYGGRGIKVAPRWWHFEEFLSDMGKKPSPEMSINRIDNDGDYEPGNCEWADDFKQQSNTSTNRRIELDGESKILAQWSRESGLGEGTIRSRIASGWDKQSALTLAKIEPIKNLSQMRFGKLVAQFPDGRQGGYIMWHCLCDCGNTHRVRSGHLLAGRIRSCGCLVRGELLTP